MRKTGSFQRFENLPPARLYLDDLKLIEERFRESSGEVEITVGDYALDSTQEIPEVSRSASHALKFWCRKPDVSLRFTRDQIYLGLYEDTAEAWGLASRVKDVLRHCRSFSTRAYGFRWPAVVLWNVGVMGVLSNRIRNSLALSLSCWLFLCLGGTCIACWIYVSSNFAIIYPYRRSDNPGFFRRNKDRLVLALISALVGAALTAVVTVLLKHFRIL